MILTGGRNLQASDVGTDNVLVSSLLNSVTSLKGELKPGSTITLMSSDGRTTKQVHIVGFYQSTGSTYGQIFAVNDTVTALASAGQGVTQNFYIKVDTNQVGNALHKISQLAPNAGVQNLADIGDFINSYINNTLLMLTALASLSLLAGVIIIANAVALAMLERRRELGILKSVGYTSRSILGEVLVENGIVGGTGALLAMLLVTLITSLLGTFLFKTTFGVSWYIAIGLIGGVALLAIITALLVAWNAVRIRPLEVLRYE
jgi:ABC-type antimicrobial peptide transport system permease subunit